MDIATIRSMGPNTDVHDILKRLAYRFSEHDGDGTYDNWRRAQERLANFSEKYKYMDSAERLHEHISYMVELLRSTNSTDEDETKNRVFERIADDAFRLPEVDTFSGRMLQAVPRFRQAYLY